MRPLLVFLYFLCVLPVIAQKVESTGIQLYPVGNQFVRANGDGSGGETFSSVKVRDFGPLIQVSLDGQATKYYTPSLFLNASGLPYSSVSSTAAFAAFLSALPVASGGGGGGGGAVTKPSTAASPTYSSATGAGSVSGGALMVSIINTGTNAGTVQGGILPAGSTITYPVLVSNTYPTITYDATGTSFSIQVIR